MRIKPLIAATVLATGALMPGQAVMAETEPLAITGQEAVEEFAAIYGCKVDINVFVEPIEIKQKDLIEPENSEDVVGTAKPGKIILDPIIKIYEVDFPGVGWHTALHETSHACTEKTTYSKPYILEGAGIKMIGALGLGGIGIDQNGKRVRNFLIDEGAAEVIASEISGIGSPVLQYEILTDITLELMNKYGITVQELQDFQEKSDLIGFLGRIYGVKPNQVTNHMIERTFNYYITELKTRGANRAS